MRRGSTLITVLLLVTLLFIMGMAFLGKRVAQMKGVRRSINQAQAAAVAHTGLEHARVKLNKDYAFPPSASVSQTVFSYTEEVLGPDGERAGDYTVEIDQTYAYEPFYLIVIRSTGRVGRVAGTGEAFSRRTVVAELDAAPDLVSGVRGSDDDPTTYTNPNYWRIISVRDYGGF